MRKATDENESRASDLPSFFQQPNISDTSVINQYINLTPDLGSFIQYGLDNFESIRYVKSKDPKIRRRWNLNILDYTSCCDYAVATGQS
jgi:hypothetical protein